MFFVVDEHRASRPLPRVHDVHAPDPEPALATDVCGERQKVHRQRSLTPGRARGEWLFVGFLACEGIGDHLHQSWQAGRGGAASIVAGRGGEGANVAVPVCLARRPRSSGDRAPASGAGCAGPNPAGGTSRNTLYQQELCRGWLSTSTRWDPFLTLICHHHWEETGRKRTRFSWLSSAPPVHVWFFVPGGLLPLSFLLPKQKDNHTHVDTSTFTWAIYLGIFLAPY